MEPVYGDKRTYQDLVRQYHHENVDPWLVNNYLSDMEITIKRLKRYMTYTKNSDLEHKGDLLSLLATLQKQAEELSNYVRS